MVDAGDAQRYKNQAIKKKKTLDGSHGEEILILRIVLI